MRNSIYVPLLLLTAAMACFSQTDTGTILGSVTDASGGVIPNAQVTIENQEQT